jgi:hypothetical protein
MSLKPKKIPKTKTPATKYKGTRWGNKEQRRSIMSKGWQQTNNWGWAKGDYRVTIYKDDDEWWHTYAFHNTKSVHFETTKKKSVAVKTTLRILLEDKVEEWFK